MSLGFPAAGPAQPTGELICGNVSDFLAPFVTFFMTAFPNTPSQNHFSAQTERGVLLWLEIWVKPASSHCKQLCNRNPSTKIVFSTGDCFLGGKDKYFDGCSQGTSQQDSSV